MSRLDGSAKDVSSAKTDASTCPCMHTSGSSRVVS
jgi:hypothetical protein